MSARLMKKILKEQEAEQLRKYVDSEGGDVVEEESDVSPGGPTPSRNPFDLLDDQALHVSFRNVENAGYWSLCPSSMHGHDVPECEVELETDDGPLPAESEVLESSTAKGSSKVTISTNRKTKKKKRRNKEDRASAKSEGEKPIDVNLESLSIDKNNPEGSVKTRVGSAKIQTNPVKNSSSSVLAVDPKFLRAENELRRIFGSKVVSSFENSNSSSSRQHGGRRALRGGHNHRKTILVTPSGFWPRWDGSLSMEFLEAKDGQQFFSKTQNAFEAAKAIHDLNGIASILAHHPYHVESLLTIADVLKFSGEHQSSADAIGKALYALECAWHLSFSPLHGDCQLKYNHDTNKPIFSALFSHMQNMDRRGCHRSALEVCKLLLSLDSDDPMGALFCIDYFSLRAEEYAWLEQFAEEYRSDNSLWLFPNFSYSLAICRFYLEHEAATRDYSADSEKATSMDLMKQALILHPLVLKKLVAKAPLKDSAWTGILKHTFFECAKPGSPSLEHLISIYVERNYLLWRLPDLQKLLKEAAHLVIESLNLNSSEARDWACVREETFSSEKNEYSHLMISDFSDSAPTIPPDDLRNLMIDPHMAHAMQHVDEAAIPEEARAPREVLNRNPVMVFLESLLPWIDYGVNDNGHRIDQHDEGVEE
ncbi:hypothetical protein ACLOJK_009002 [Asimina triloba]